MTLEEHGRTSSDYLNHLIREDNREAGYSYTYDYDDAGNRTSKKVYAFTLGNLGSVLEDYSYTYLCLKFQDLPKELIMPILNWKIGTMILS